jgi:hypothetical protein
VHVVIAEAEVMARLMHHHVAHQVVHSAPGFAPFGSQRFAEQPDARRELPALPDRLVGQGFAFVEAGKMPAVRDIDRCQLLGGREILDLQNDIAHLVAELRRQFGESRFGHCLHLGPRGRLSVMHGEADMG